MKIIRDERGVVQVEHDNGGIITSHDVVDTNLLYEIWQELKSINDEIGRLYGEIETIRSQR